MTSAHIYKIIRYIISGGSAAAVTIGTLYLFTDMFKIWYLYASIIAYGAGFLVSFTLQKFWTFSHYSLENLRAELVLYMSIGLANLFLNGLLMYGFVDILKIWYILAEVLSAGLIAIFSFPVYKKLVFNHQAIL